MTKVHSDDYERRALVAAVDSFAEAMKAKLLKKMNAGRSGWDDPSWTPAQIRQALIDHVQKCDPVDVANYALFLWTRLTVEQWNERHDPNLWRYPSRGEFAKTGKWYLVTTESGEVRIEKKRCNFGQEWWDGTEWIRVRAWREIPEPAPELEDGSGTMDLPITSDAQAIRVAESLNKYE